MIKNVILGVFMLLGAVSSYKASAMEEEEKSHVPVSSSRTSYVNSFDVMGQMLHALNRSFQSAQKDGTESPQSDSQIFKSYIQEQLQQVERREDREFLQSMLEELEGMPEEGD
jgi:hypothetical protein